MAKLTVHGDEGIRLECNDSLRRFESSELRGLLNVYLAKAYNDKNKKE